MKLGVSYNIFSGLELLEGSIKCIRPYAKHINVCYQVISNTGIRKPEIHDFVLWLHKKGLIDSNSFFFPMLTSPKQNETFKRNMGLQVCRMSGCTHFMSMDSDEYYKGDQLEYVIKDIEKHGYRSTACQMQTYYKSTKYKLDPPESYYVPLIYKIDGRKFDQGAYTGVKVDPSRKMKGKMKKYSRKEIEMHHLSYVRDDIRDKLRSASASVNFRDRIEEIADYYDNWEWPMPAYLGGSKKRLHKLNLSNITFQ
jgi:hypothetical protein